MSSRVQVEIYLRRAQRENGHVLRRAIAQSILSGRSWCIIVQLAAPQRCKAINQRAYIFIIYIVRVRTAIGEKCNVLRVP